MFYYCLSTLISLVPPINYIQAFDIYDKLGIIYSKGEVFMKQKPKKKKKQDLGPKIFVWILILAMVFSTVGLWLAYLLG